MPSLVVGTPIEVVVGACVVVGATDGFVCPACGQRAAERVTFIGGEEPGLRSSRHVTAAR